MEIWKPVLGYEGIYSVSSFGNVRNDITKKPKYPTITTGDPRPYIGLWRNNKIKIFRIHTLVISAFIGPKPEGMECCHNDGNPQNNHIDNLRWDTSKNNHADKIRHGTTNRGERCGTAKLTQIQVDEIRKDNRKQSIIAAEYGVRQNTISRIKNKVRWAHS